MKRLFFILLTLLTCYLAGVYRYPALMLLSAIEAMLFGISFFLPYYFRKNLKAGFLRHREAAEKNVPFHCTIVSENTGRLPISCFRIKFRYGYGQGKGKSTWQGYGGIECGKAEHDFQVAGHYCGIIQLTLECFFVYDYLALFPKRKKQEDKTEIAVFPQERALQVELSSFGLREGYLPQERQAGRDGDAHDEVRQLREYRFGDSSRHIHWNQSARMDSLWVKEFEKKIDCRLDLFLDMEGIKDITRPKMDAFYELLSAIVHGLLNQAGVVRVSWYNIEENRIEDIDISKAAQCRDLLLRLYRSEPSLQQGNKGRKARSFPNIGGDSWKLDLELNWYQGEVLIFRFSGKPEILAEQIEKERFVL